MFQLSAPHHGFLQYRKPAINPIQFPARQALWWKMAGKFYPIFFVGYHCHCLLPRSKLYQLFFLYWRKQSVHNLPVRWAGLLVVVPFFRQPHKTRWLLSWGLPGQYPEGWYLFYQLIREFFVYGCIEWFVFGPHYISVIFIWRSNIISCSFTTLLEWVINGFPVKISKRIDRQIIIAHLSRRGSFDLKILFTQKNSQQKRKKNTVALQFQFNTSWVVFMSPNLCC